VLIVLLYANYRWLAPLYAHHDELLAGELEPERAAALIRRAARYPYLAFFVPLLGVVLTSVAFAAVKATVHSTPIRLVVLSMLLVTTHGVALATISFGTARLAMRGFLEVPGAVVAPQRWEPDLPWSMSLGFTCVAFVAWTVMAVMSLDNQCRMAAAVGTGTCDHPVVVRSIVGFGVGGVLMLILVGWAAWMLARDHSRDAAAVAAGLDGLAVESEAGPVDTLPVLSLDEVGKLTEAFNRLNRRLSEHDRKLRRSATEARLASQRQLEFLSVVSHDLRTPLHSIVGFSELLSEDPDARLTDDQQEDIEIIHKAGHHLLNLVDDIVDLSKIETGMMALSTSEVDLRRLVEEALEAGTGLRSGEEIELHGEIPDKLPGVVADETRLRQVIFNLLGNALKFTEKGDVWVRVKPEHEGMIEIAVEDSGPGIPEESLESVFGEFEQLHSRGAGEAKGTGLGLAISQRLVMMHGGKMWAANRPGGGSVCKRRTRWPAG